MELEHILNHVREIMDAENGAREEGLRLSRECIRQSANCIRAVHRNDMEKARDLLGRASETLGRAQNALDDYPRIYNAGFLQDAEKEYAEAETTMAMVLGRDIPMPDEIGVDAAPYLNGLGEAAGELRRYVLDLIRDGELERAEALLEMMDEIYFLLASIDYPSALTGGLRRTNDMVRGVLERTRGDLTTAIRRQSLENTIRDFEAKLENGKGL